MHRSGSLLTFCGLLARSPVTRADHFYLQPEMSDRATNSLRLSVGCCRIAPLASWMSSLRCWSCKRRPRSRSVCTRGEGILLALSQCATVFKVPNARTLCSLGPEVSAIYARLLPPRASRVNLEPIRICLFLNPAVTAWPVGTHD